MFPPAAVNQLVIGGFLPGEPTRLLTVSAAGFNGSEKIAAVDDPDGLIVGQAGNGKRCCQE